MALLYPVVVPCSVILSRIAGDWFSGPTIHSADLNDIGVARFFRCPLTPITAAAHAALSLSVKCFLSPFDMLEEIGKSGVPDVALPDICMPGLFGTATDACGGRLSLCSLSPVQALRKPSPMTKRKTVPQNNIPEGLRLLSQPFLSRVTMLDSRLQTLYNFIYLLKERNV